MGLNTLANVLETMFITALFRGMSLLSFSFSFSPSFFFFFCFLLSAEKVVGGLAVGVSLSGKYMYLHVHAM